MPGLPLLFHLLLTKVLILIGLSNNNRHSLLNSSAEAMKEREAEFLQSVFDRTFGDWSDKDWKKVRDQYFKSI